MFVYTTSSQVVKSSIRANFEFMWGAKKERKKKKKEKKKRKKRKEKRRN